MDITLATPRLASRLRAWKDSQEQNFSDHKTIIFELGTVAPSIAMKRGYNKLDITRFREMIKNKVD